MNDVVISVERLSKQYRLGVVGTGTLAHDLNRWWACVRGKEDPTLKVGQVQRAPKGPRDQETKRPRDQETKGPKHQETEGHVPAASGSPLVPGPLVPGPWVPTDEYVWALKDVSFEVRRGEVLGIIGRNGAGKSTLLKILSRVTAPTEGQVKIKGRIASLLEVGTGMHPELTGRENIFLNGAILGMTKDEVTRKLDEIIDFSGCEKYIDTPVKRYSSGMHVRLGFAVAAHLEPEILIVDEVLAVGDAEFQKKCLGKMQDVASGGRTVLFVSHNMTAVSVLCGEAILLRDGRLVDRGPSKRLVEEYLSLGCHGSATARWPFSEAPGGEHVRLHAVEVVDTDGSVSYDHCCGDSIALCMEFWCFRESALVPSFHLYSQSGILLFPTGTLHVPELAQKVYGQGLHRCTCVIPRAFLNSGKYLVHAFVSRDTDGLAYAHVPDAVSFQVINDGTGQGNAYTAGDWPGLLRPLLPWTVEHVGGLPTGV